MSKNEVDIKRKPGTEREGEGEEDREWERDKREGKRNIKSKIETEREKGTVKKKCDILLLVKINKNNSRNLTIPKSFSLILDII